MSKNQAGSVSVAAKTKSRVGGQRSDPEESAATITTAIHIPKSTWNLLRVVAFHRAQKQGGRVSVSKLIAELVEGHRRELERECNQSIDD